MVFISSASHFSIDFSAMQPWQIFTQYPKNEMQLLLNCGAWEERPPCGHLIENAAHTPVEKGRQMSLSAQENRKGCNFVLSVKVPNSSIFSL